MRNRCCLKMGQEEIRIIMKKGKRKRGVELICVACGNDFYVPAYRKETAKYCSYYCHRFGQYKNVTIICHQCGKEFIKSTSRGWIKYCSEDCRHVNRMSEKERRKAQKASQKLKRGNNSSRNLRTNLKRAGVEFKCSICGYEKHTYCIDVHHIDGNPDNNTLENIAMYCAICHRIVHKQ